MPIRITENHVALERAMRVVLLVFVVPALAALAIAVAALIWVW